MRQVLVTLSHGLKNSNSKLYHVKLHEMTGHDEQFLDSIKNELPSFLQVTELLKQVILFEPEITTPQKDELFKSLTIGDRVCLLLNLQKITFGNILSCVTKCNFCSDQASFDFNIDDLLNLNLNTKHEDNYPVKTKNFSLNIRPLTVLDQQLLLSASSHGNIKKNSTNQLMKSCIVSSVPSLPETFPEEIVDAINIKLNEIDPMANIILDLACPECKKSLQIPFDVEDFILRQIRSQTSSLEKEIHWLALNYKWSENDILNLPIQKRHRYIQLINDTLSGE